MMVRSLSFRRRLIFLASAGATILVPSATVLAQSTAAQVQSISEKDKAEGAKANPQLIAEFGGAVTGPQASYVESVGKNIALQSGLSNARGDFTVTLLNSPVNNAFAIPGGYIYVTRQLVALMNNEAELAGVLGHEVGHVAAQHSKKRQSAAQRNSILGVLGAVLSGAILGNSTAGQLVQKFALQGSQLATLSYSRGQETEADNLGITYLGRAGYNQKAMATVLLSLANQNALEAKLMGTSSSVPTWASTHPDPASRVRAAAAKAGASATGNTNRDNFLKSIEGVMYGDDPHQGVVEGRKFTHPDLKIGFEAPSGFSMVNGTRAVSIGGQSGKAEFTGAQYTGDMDSYIKAVFGGLTEQNQPKLSPSSIQRTTVNGISAAYASVQTQGSSGMLDVVVFAYEFSKSEAFHFMTISAAGNAKQFDPLFASMRRISDSEASAVRPRKLVVVTAKSGDTLQSMASRMAYSDAPLERFLVLNGLGAGSALSAGQKVKIVTY